MKYFPLIWAALWRKPARTILTLLSVTAAFTLFGLAIGVRATYADIVARARPDRFFVSPRFDDGFLTLAQRDRIAHMDGVTKVGSDDFFIGYYRDPKNQILPDMMDRGMRETSDVPLSPRQWDQLEATPSGVIIDDHTAVRFGLKTGDAFPVLTSPPWPARQDGSRLWPFTIIGIVKNPLWARGGLVLGNYDYLDKERPAARSSTTYQLHILVSDPARIGELTDRIDKTFANSPNPTWSFSDELLAQLSTGYQFNIPLVTESVAAAGLFMILFLIGNGIAQSVRERIPEFAILKTLGFSDAGVMALVFVEAAIPCLLGAVIGFSIAWAAAAKISGLSVLQKLALAPPSLSPRVLGIGLMFAVAVAFASAVLPAWRIRRLDVATALRR
jgi:putative ABC transport system permease protein